MFSLVSGLPPQPPPAVLALFGCFVGTTPLFDSPLSHGDLSLIVFSSGPPTAGRPRVSRFSRMEFLCMRGLDWQGQSRSRVAPLVVPFGLPDAVGSLKRGISGNHPAYRCPCPTLQVQCDCPHMARGQGGSLFFLYDSCILLHAGLSGAIQANRLPRRAAQPQPKSGVQEQGSGARSQNRARSCSTSG